MALLAACAASRSDFSESLRKSLVQQHIAMEIARLRGAQTGHRPLESIRLGLYALTEDNLSFLKQIGLAKVKEGRIVLPTYSRRLVSFWNRGREDSVRRMVLSKTLSSKYTAYLRFLLNLDRLGGSFRLRTRGQKRTRESPLREHLHSAGFATDVASFYTLRDFFCDFRLVNFVPDKAKEIETIFLTSKISRNPVKGFRNSITAGNLRIYYDRRISNRSFCFSLVEGYKSLTPAWARWVSMLDLRDTVTLPLQISDWSFDYHFLGTLKNDGCKRFKIDCSTGYRISERTYGATIKAKKMPLMPGNRPIHFVAITRRV